jgi:glutamate-5-semialdehyde dehydrogenase
MSAVAPSMIDQIVAGASRARAALAATSGELRNRILTTLADLLHSNTHDLLAANARDCQRAVEAGLAAPLLERLKLNAKSISAMCDDLAMLVNLPDPLARVERFAAKNSQLTLQRVAVPLGVLAVIYESRPNVTIDCAALAIKSGNAAVLRGGKEASDSNQALMGLVHLALQQNGLAPETIGFIAGFDRKEIADLLKHERELALVIPRGGPALHEHCRSVSRVPVLSGGVGICHMFVDASAKLKASANVVLSAKLQKPSACNALDVLLLHHAIAADFLELLQAHPDAAHVHIKACERSVPIFQRIWKQPNWQRAADADFHTEWLSASLSIKVVDDLDQALARIANVGSGHSEAILTEDASNAARFLRAVDAAAVYHNASTRFTDGSEFGLGAEVAVSTDKLHARGPVGLDALCTYKWVGVGNYLLRD